MLYTLIGVSEFFKLGLFVLCWFYVFYIGLYVLYWFYVSFISAFCVFYMDFICFISVADVRQMQKRWQGWARAGPGPGPPPLLDFSFLIGFVDLIFRQRVSQSLQIALKMSLLEFSSRSTGSSGNAVRNCCADPTFTRRGPG